MVVWGLSHFTVHMGAQHIFSVQVGQPFDEAKFNFKKALQQEVLFQFDASSPGGLTYSASAPVTKSPNLVFINISPIEYGHVLLVPRVLDGLNQVCSFPGSASKPRRVHCEHSNWDLSIQ